MKSIVNSPKQFIIPNYYTVPGSLFHSPSKIFTSPSIINPSLSAFCTEVTKTTRMHYLRIGHPRFISNKKDRYQHSRLASICTYIRICTSDVTIDLCRWAFGLHFPFDVWPTFAGRILRHETLSSSLSPPPTRREASNVLPVQFGRERFLGEYIEPAIFLETNRAGDVWDRNYVGGLRPTRDD